jgi:hypothetical protein
MSLFKGFLTILTVASLSFVSLLILPFQQARTAHAVTPTVGKTMIILTAPTPIAILLGIKFLFGDDKSDKQKAVEKEQDEFVACLSANRGQTNIAGKCPNYCAALNKVMKYVSGAEYIKEGIHSYDAVLNKYIEHSLFGGPKEDILLRGSVRGGNITFDHMSPYDFITGYERNFSNILNKMKANLDAIKVLEGQRKQLVAKRNGTTDQLARTQLNMEITHKDVYIGRLIRDIRLIVDWADKHYRNEFARVDALLKNNPRYAEAKKSYDRGAYGGIHQGYAVWRSELLSTFDATRNGKLKQLLAKYEPLRQQSKVYVDRFNAGEFPIDQQFAVCKFKGDGTVALEGTSLFSNVFTSFRNMFGGQTE